MRLRPRQKALAVTVALAIAGIAGALAWNRYSYSEADTHVAELRPLMSSYLWDLDREGAEQHARVLLEASGYARLQVAHLDGRVFVDVQRGDSHGLRHAVEQAGLVPLARHVHALEWVPAGAQETQVIGALTVYRPDWDVLFYVQVGTLVLVGSLVLTSRVERQRRDAAARDLQLVQEKANRLEAEARLAERELQLQERRNLESLGRLAAGVAHDLNNILTVMIGSAEAIELLSTQPRVRDQAGTILSAADRAASLTHQLLAYGRRQVLEPRPVSVHDLVEAFETILSRAAGDQVTMHLRLEAGRSVVQADPAQLEQVLLNLVVNARDAMPQGGTVDVITFDLEGPTPVEGGQELGPGPWLGLAVRDTGQGMDEETRGSVFLPFFTTKAAGKGTGLGLATVYGIVRQSGGHITVTSRPGEGSCFTVYLPRLDDAAPRDPGRRAYSLDDTLDPRGSRVLLVEDRDDVREVMAEALRRHGMQVQEACDGLMALTIAGEGAAAFDLLVTDLTMPVLGGRELAERLRALRPDLRVLFVSGDPGAELGEDFRSSARTSVLHKPFGSRALVDACQELLAARVGQR